MTIRTILPTLVKHVDGVYTPAMSPGWDEKKRIGWRLGTFEAVTGVQATVSLINQEWFLAVDGKTVASGAGKLARAEEKITECLHLLWSGFRLRTDLEKFEQAMREAEKIVRSSVV